MDELIELLEEVEGMDDDLILNITNIISINPEERLDKVVDFITNAPNIKAIDVLDFISTNFIEEEFKDVIEEDNTEIFSDEDEEVNYEDMFIVDEDSLNDDKVFSGEFRENCFEWRNGQDTITCTISQKKFRNKILKLAEQYPEEVIIQAMNDGITILAKIPLRYLIVRRPRELSKEEKIKAAERLKAVRKIKKKD